MTDLHKIGNDSFRKALFAIVKPTMKAGGNESAVMVVLESTIVAVLLALYRNPKKAAAMFEEGTVPGVLERLSSYEAKHK